MKVKIFEGINYSTTHQKQNGVRCLEDEVQDWLRKNDSIIIHQIKQSSASGDNEPVVTVISIWYRN